MSPVELAQSIGSAALVVSLMFAAGLELRGEQLLALRRRPRILAFALALNLFVVPLAAWLLIAVLDVPLGVSVGVLLCAAAPGGPAAVLYANSARADLPLTVGLTVVMPALGVLSTPLTLSLVPELQGEIAIPVVPMVASLIAFQIAPLLVGMAMRRRTPERADRLAPKAKLVANLALVGLALMLLVLKGHVLDDLDARAWLAIVATAALAGGLGYFAALPRIDSARAGAIVAVSRNVSVAIMLASTFFRSDPLVDATVLCTGLVALLIPLGASQWWRRAGVAARSRPASQAKPAAP